MTGDITSAVRVGSRVRVRDEDGEEEFSIVGPEDAEPLKGSVSVDSPVGRALLGCIAGEVVKVRAPGGVRLVHIIAAD